MIASRTLLLAALVGSAMAACPNGCSGNGICGANDKCSCYQNWQGPDCSLRTCTYSLAWADTADGTNQAHYYAECSNKGVCDRKTGECKCFDGYEGKGCRRSTCPDACSGHGTCEYIDELAVDFEDRRAGPGATKMTASATSLSNAVVDADNTRQVNGFLYQLWDAQKIQGCKCDLGYTGPDCAGRIAPKGDDPLTTVKSVTQTQMVQITAASAIGATSTKVNDGRSAATQTVGTTWAGTTIATVPAGPDTFFIVYYDQYGGVWRTDAIEGGGFTAVAARNAAVAPRVQAALRNLPNEVLEGVTVTARTGAQKKCVRAIDGAQHIPSAGGHGTDNTCALANSDRSNAANDFGAVAQTYDFDVTFADKPGQTGVQFLLEVNTLFQGDGAFPVSRGVAETSSVAVVELHVIASADKDTLSELAECSDRGLDNGDGECECFDGFRGLACEEQEALV
jgi:hypothetical protein